jgi:hypothetical protein
VVARELPKLAGKTNRAMGKQNLGLVDAAWVKKKLARGRVACRVPATDPEIRSPTGIQHG